MFDKNDDVVGQIYSRLAALGFVLLTDDLGTPKSAHLFEYDRFVKLDQPSVRAVVGPLMKEPQTYGVTLYQEKAPRKEVPSSKSFISHIFDKFRDVPAKKILKDYDLSDAEFLALETVPLCETVSPAHSRLAQHLYHTKSDVCFMAPLSQVTADCVPLIAFYRGDTATAALSQTAEKQKPAYDIGSDEHIEALAADTLKQYRSRYELNLRVYADNDLMTVRMNAPWHKVTTGPQYYAIDDYVSSAKDVHRFLYNKCRLGLASKILAP